MSFWVGGRRDMEGWTGLVWIRGRDNRESTMRGSLEITNLMDLEC